MWLPKFVIILSLFCGAAQVRAQEISGPSGVPDQWQLTLDVIKGKAQALLVQNNAIQAQHRQLAQQEQSLQQALKDQQNKREAMLLFLRERHGRTDQQVRLEELSQAVKTKKQQAKLLDEQLINLKKIKENSPPPAPAALALDSQLADLRQRLEEEKRQEVILENELNDLRSGGQSQNLNVDILEEQNKRLELRLKNLQEQQLLYQRASPHATLASSNQRKYEELKKRKDQLEVDIRAYETRMDQLKDSSLSSLSWPRQKKRLIHEMVQKDARNNQLRDKIKMLQEDVNILRDQVAKLERRVNFDQGKDNMQRQ